MRSIVWLSMLISAALTLSCSPAEDTDGSAREIEVDTAHTGVMGLSTLRGMCTATIVGGRAETGFALTAAHCCRGSQAGDMALFVGQDYANAEAMLEVLDAQIHPLYEGTAENDACMLTFATAGAERLRVLPLMMPDEDVLGPGDTMSVIGYGTVPHDAESNTRRRRVPVVLTRTEPLAVYYDQTEAGPCYGDSGGPGLHLVNGVEKIAAITSGGSRNCTSGEGAGARVSRVYENLIGPYLAGEPLPIACQDCVRAALSEVGDCADRKGACLEDASCNELLQCYSACGTQVACASDCSLKHADGRVKYEAIKACVCEDACTAYCAGDALCAGDGS